MKEKELRKHAHCTNCAKPIGHTGIPLFWTVQISHYSIDIEAIKKQDGLAAVLGGSSDLAAVMGPDPDMASSELEVTITLCEHCALSEGIPVAALAFLGEEEG